MGATGGQGLCDIGLPALVVRTLAHRHQREGLLILLQDEVRASLVGVLVVLALVLTDRRVYGA